MFISALQNIIQPVVGGNFCDRQIKQHYIFSSSLIKAKGEQVDLCIWTSKSSRQLCEAAVLKYIYTHPRNFELKETCAQKAMFNY